jgi:hypothetical protein
MVTILFVLGFAAAVGVAVWTSRRTTGTGPARHNRYLGGGGSADFGYPQDHNHGGGGDGGGWSGGGGDGGGGN